MVNPVKSVYAWVAICVSAVVTLGLLFAWNAGLKLIGTNKDVVIPPSKVRLAAQLTDTLLQLNEEYKSAATEQEKQEKLKEMVSAAGERKKMVLALIETNPDAIENVLIDRKKREKLPREVESYLEEGIVLKGELEILHSDGPNFEPGLSRYDYFLVRGDERYVLHSRQELPTLLSGSEIRVNGFRLDDKVGVLSGGFETIQAALPGHTVKKVAALLVNFRNSQVQPYTQVEIRDMFYSGARSVRDYYQEASFGNVDFTGIQRRDIDVFGWYTVDFDATPCNSYGWSKAAYEIARNNGVNLNPYDYVMHIFPVTGGCASGATMGKKNFYITFHTGPNTLNSKEQQQSIMAHELGHLLGVDHSEALGCFDNNYKLVTISSGCVAYWYGDDFDVMGNGRKMWHMNNFHKGRLNWFVPSNTHDVTTSGIYTLAPVERKTQQVQALRIKRLPLYLQSFIPNTNRFNTSGGLGHLFPSYYYLEYRQPFGFDDFAHTDPVVNGVSVRIASLYDSPSLGSTMLLDMTPSDFFTDPLGRVYPQVVDSSLRAGRIFTDEQSGVRLLPLNLSNSSAEVRIDLLSPNVSETTREVFSDNAETGTSGWEATGLWHRSSRRSSSGVTSWYYGRESTGNYETGQRNSGDLTSPEIDIRGLNNLRLEFRHHLGTEDNPPYDLGSIFISKDRMNWTRLNVHSYTTDGIWNKKTVRLIPRTLDLPDSSFQHGSSLWIRFTFDTNIIGSESQNDNFEGWYIDDIKVVGEERTTLTLVGSSNTTLTAGGSYSVSWATTNVANSIPITISIGHKNAVEKQVLVQNTLNDGSENVSIPANVLSGDDYEFVVEAGCTLSLQPCLVGDRSDQALSIIKPTLTLTAPNGDDVWGLQAPATITWRSELIPSSATIAIKAYAPQASGTTVEYQLGTSSNDGSEGITVPHIPPGNTYRVKISANLGGVEVFDESDQPFTIGGLSDLMVPEGPVVHEGNLVAGNPVRFNGKIKNQGNNAAKASQAKFQVDYGNNGSIDASIGEVEVQDLESNQEMRVVSPVFSSLPVGNHRIILCVDPGNTIRESNETNNCNPVGSGVITVVAYVGSVSVGYPNSGETLYRGARTELRLSFSETAPFPPLDLFLFKSSGASLGKLAGNFLSRDTFEWQVGRYSNTAGLGVTAPAGTYKIGVAVRGSITVLDHSDVAFRISTPPLPTIALFRFSPTSVRSGNNVTMTYSGRNMSAFKLFLNCPPAVTAQSPSVGKNYCNTETMIPSAAGTNTFVLRFTTTSSSPQSVKGTLKAVDLSGTVRTVRNSTLSVRP